MLTEWEEWRQGLPSASAPTSSQHSPLIGRSGSGLAPREPSQGALRRPREMARGGRKEEGSGWGTRVYLWWIHVDVWQNQYNIVK